MDDSLNLLMNKIPLGIILFNEENNIVFINAKAHDYLFPALEIHINKFMKKVKDLVLVTREKQVAQERDINVYHGKNIYSCKAQSDLANFFSPGAIMVILQEKETNIQLEQAILKAEKLAVVGQLAIGTLVEIRNPLTIARGFCQLLKLRLGTQNDHPDDYICFITEEIEKICEIVDNYYIRIQHMQSGVHEEKSFLPVPPEHSDNNC